MTKTFCDRCEKEVRPWEISTVARATKNGSDKCVELCPSCCEAFDAWAQNAGFSVESGKLKAAKLLVNSVLEYCEFGSPCNSNCPLWPEKEGCGTALAKKLKEILQ